MNTPKKVKASDVSFDYLKQLESQFVQLFPALDIKTKKEFTSVFAVSEAVLNWYLVPVIEDTEDGIANSAKLIQHLVTTVADLVSVHQKSRINFKFPREAIGGLAESTLDLKIVREHKELEIFNQEKRLVWLFSIFIEDENEKAEIVQIAAV